MNRKASRMRGRDPGQQAGGAQQRPDRNLLGTVPAVPSWEVRAAPAAGRSPRGRRSGAFGDSAQRGNDASILSSTDSSSSPLT